MVTLANVLEAGTDQIARKIKMSVYQIHVFMRMDVKIYLIITIVLVNWVGQENSVAQMSMTVLASV